MKKNKNAFSMLMTLLVIIIFSIIVVLGLKISSLQLENNKYYITMNEFLNKENDLKNMFLSILQANIKSCHKNITVKYEDKYEIKSNIAYSPGCKSENIGNVSTQLLINMKLFDKNNDLEISKVIYATY